MVEKQVMSNNGCCFNASILPYRTLEDEIGGVVITFVDITKFKALEVNQSIEAQDEEPALLKDRLLDEVQQFHKQAAASEDLS